MTRTTLDDGKPFSQIVCNASPIEPVLYFGDRHILWARISGSSAPETVPSHPF